MKIKPLMLALTSVAVLLCGPAASRLSAQLAVPPPMPAYQLLSDQQIDQLLGPIALYPDPLLAIILPAATLPMQVVMADRYILSGGDPNLIDQQPWDGSVQALARYPSVLQYMDDNLAWTTELGQAFLNQQQQVMDSIQRLRISAQNYGNLQSTPQEQVVEDNGDIEILPAQPDVIYVPVYQPAYVYYRSGFGLSFGVGCNIGSWLDRDFDWHRHNLFVWDHDHPRPANWWHEKPTQRTDWMARRGTVWHPEDHRNNDRAHQGDRGWVAPSVRTPDPRNNNTIVHMSRPRAEPRPAAQPRPTAQPRPAAVPRQETVRESGVIHVATPVPAPRPAPNGAFVGSGSAHDARDFSNRGHESMQTVTHTEPVHSAPPASHPAPPAQSGGGGGFHGGGGGGSQPRH